ncbi:MAG TPA: hypothetical protein VM618_10240 [Acidimicrobiia bacterium]|nr:hypothetical protein [Acidimicrobiia bacterium]
MEAEGHFGVRMVFEDGVLEVFSHGKSSIRLAAGTDVPIVRAPFKDGLRVTIRHPDGPPMLAFNAEQKAAVEALLDAFEAAGR